MCGARGVDGYCVDAIVSADQALICTPSFFGARGERELCALEAR